MTQPNTEDGAARCQEHVTSPKRGRKQCALAFGHDGKHVTVIHKMYVPVTMNDMQTFSIVVKPAERAALAPKSKPGAAKQERTDVMREYDKRNLELYAAWVEDDKPEDFKKTRLGKIHVTKDKVGTVKFLIRSSQTFLNTTEGGGHGIGIEFGDDGVKDREGRSVVSWRVIDKRERKAKDS